MKFGGRTKQFAISLIFIIATTSIGCKLRKKSSVAKNIDQKIQKEIQTFHQKITKHLSSISAMINEEKEKFPNENDFLILPYDLDLGNETARIFFYIKGKLGLVAVMNLKKPLDKGYNKSIFLGFLVKEMEPGSWYLENSRSTQVISIAHNKNESFFVRLQASLNHLRSFESLESNFFLLPEKDFFWISSKNVSTPEFYVSKNHSSLSDSEYASDGYSYVSESSLGSKKQFPEGISDPSDFEYYSTIVDEEVYSQPRQHFLLQAASFYPKGDLSDNLAYYKNSILKCKFHKKMLNLLRGIHEKNIAHLDIKSDNILIDENNKFVVTDTDTLVHFKEDIPLQVIYDRRNAPLFDFSHRRMTKKNAFWIDIWGAALVMFEVETNTSTKKFQNPQLVNQKTFINNIDSQLKSGEFSPNKFLLWSSRNAWEQFKPLLESSKPVYLADLEGIVKNICPGLSK